MARLRKKDVDWMINDFLSKPKTFTFYAKKFNISQSAISAWFKKKGIPAIHNSILKRKYTLNEKYFDVIGADQAYIIGFLYADGYNNTDRTCVVLSLANKDEHILNSINTKIGSNRPLQTIVRKEDNQSDQKRLSISSIKISKRLEELGMVKAKTFKITYPEWLQDDLHSHFIRGYMDGDGWIGTKSCSLTGTESFCNSITDILKSLNVNTYMRTRHPEKNHNIRSIEVGGRLQTLRFLDWLYKDATLYLNRKYDKYIQMKHDLEESRKSRLCSITGCDKKHYGKGYCSIHYYEFCDGAEKRRRRFLDTGK